MSLWPEKPDVIWTGFIGASSALLGASLAGLQAWRRQSAQLKHDGQQKELERQHALKREVYLPLIECGTEAFNFVVQIATLPMADAQAQRPMNALANAITKLDLIAPREVMEPAHQCQDMLVKSIMALMPERIGIEELSEQLKVIDGRLTALSEARKSHRERFERHIENRTNDQALTAAFNQRLLEIENQVTPALNRMSEMISERTKLQFKLLRRSFAQIKAARAFATQALIAMRADLGTPIDAKWLTEFNAASAAALDSAVEQFQHESEAQLQEIIGRANKDKDQPSLPVE